MKDGTFEELAMRDLVIAELCELLWFLLENFREEITDKCVGDFAAVFW